MGEGSRRSVRYPFRSTAPMLPGHQEFSLAQKPCTKAYILQSLTFLGGLVPCMLSSLFMQVCNACMYAAIDGRVQTLFHRQARMAQLKVDKF